MAAGEGGPRRRVTDHFHQEAWTRTEQHRYEDRITDELKEIGQKLDGFGTRLTYLFGGLAVLAFILPLVAPFLRQALGFLGP